MERILKYCLAAFTASWLIAVDVHSQDAAPGEQLIQQEQQRQEALRREREGELAPFTVLPRGPLAPEQLQAEPGPCFDIHTIAVEGVQVFAASAITNLYGPYLNRCLGAVLVATAAWMAAL